MAMWLDYKPTRYEGKGFLRNLYIRIHRDITGEMGFGVGWGGVDPFVTTNIVFLLPSSLWVVV